MRILIVRYGAWGDSIIITPLIRYFSRNHEVYLHTSETGMNILALNPCIAKFIPYESDTVPDHKLQDYWEKLAKKFECHWLINMCESIERAISLHPIDPRYAYTKPERREICDKNFYEYSFYHAGFPVPEESLTPEMFFSGEEEKTVTDFFQKLNDKFVILWGLSGSGLNKTYPWTDYIIGDLLRENEDVVVVTVGDELSQVLESHEHERVIRMCGKWTMRESSLACKYASLVVAPDTGLLHASGCFDTPKIGLIGSNTINNITKHFKNDYSFEADSQTVPCAPCFRIVYSASKQCPIDDMNYLPHCMSRGIDPRKVLERIEYIIQRHGKRNNLLPSLQHQNAS